MLETAVIVLRPAHHPLWMARCAGLSLLGRALLALGDAGARYVAVLGATPELLRAALGTRHSKAAALPLPASTSAAELAELVGAAEDSLLLVLDQPQIIERANLAPLLRAAVPSFWEARGSTPDGAVVAPLRALHRGLSVSAAFASGLTFHAVPPAHPVFTCPVLSRAQLPALEAALLDTTRKPIAVDGVVAYYAMRPVSRRLTRALWDTAVTPNQATLVSMFLGLLAAPVAAQGGYGPHLLAAFLLFAGATVDCVDGELARLKHQGSRAGEWLDTLSDDLSTAGYLIGLGLGVPSLPYGLSPLWLGMGSAALFLLSNVYIYYVLARYVGVIDTTRFPYFFLSAPGRPRRPDTLRGKIGGVLVYALKRDFFVALFMLLALCGAPWLSLLLLGTGACFNAIAALLTGLLGRPGAAR